MAGIRGYFTFEVTLGERKMLNRCGWTTRRRNPLRAIVPLSGRM